MAFIDYGVVVIKDGIVVNEGIFFQNMKDAVGWSDAIGKLYDDCTNVNADGDSECFYCDRCNMKTLKDTDGEEYSVPATDCRENAFKLSKFEHEYMAYIGDDHLTLCFYKTWCEVLVDKVPAMTIVLPAGKKAHEVCVADTKIKITEVCNRVNHLSMTYKDSHYNVVFGYGIDPSFKVWNDIKVKYLSKKGAKKVDNIYNAHINK